MRVHLATLDLLAIGAYLVAVLWIGTRLRSRQADTEDFLLAGRRLTLPLFVGSLVATWYGGLLGVGEIAYTDGLVTWLTQGGYWYVSYLLFAFFIAKRVRRSGLTTLPDQIGEMHGPSARLIALLLNFLNVVPIAYVLSLGLLVHLITGWPIWLGVLVGTAAAVVYSLAGGFRAVVHTDMLQFVLMCSTIAALMIACVVSLGGSQFLRTNLPAGHLSFGGQMPLQEIIVWGVIALSTLVDPNFYHRCYAADSPETARRGVLGAVLFWLLFDVCTTFTGLYARAALPGIDARLAYPLLADLLLPVGLKGLFFAGVLATIMSTVDSYCFVGAMTLGHDLFRRTLRPQASDERVVLVTRLGILATAGVAMALALGTGGSIKAIWKTLGSLSSAAMLIPMLIGFTGWRPPGAAATAMVGGSVGTLGWAALRRWGPASAARLEPMIPGVILSLCGYAVCALRRGSRDD